MTQPIFRSSDASAPVVNNNNGTLVAALDAILVTGYPTQSITSITRSGSTATATKTSHGYTNGQVISISGANEPEYNGNVTVLNAASDTFDYTVSGTPASPATGTILASNGKTSLGWALSFTGTNKRVYKQAAGSGFQVRVDDANNVYEARVRGAESFSDIDTIGSGGFPTVAQAANGVFWQKTNNTSGDRAWLAIGDDKRLFMMIEVASGAWNALWFGDIFSFKSGDAYSCLLIGKGSSIATQNSDLLGSWNQNTASAAIAGHYIARSHTGVGSAVAMNKVIADGRLGANGGTGQPTDPTYPDPVTGTLLLSRFLLVEPAIKAVRGYIPGVWALLHSIGAMSGVANGDTFSGADGLASRDFELRTATVSNAAGAFVLETSDWPES